MRIGVVSDSHGHLEFVRPAVRMLESLEVECVLHCGDIGTPTVVELFAPWPTHFVFGNCDFDRDLLGIAIRAAGKSCHGEFGDIMLAGTRIALIHSDDRRRFQQTLASGEFDLVCFGHTHVASIERHERTLAVNPGALYRANPHSLAVVELDPLSATIIPL
jgi:putative phosphoesterase